MANKSVTALTEATAFNNATLDLLHLTINGNSRKMTAQNFAKSLRAANGVRGALVKKSAPQTAADYSSLTAITWNAESYDTDNIHDNATNNTRLTVPSGITKVKVSAGVSLANVANGASVLLRIDRSAGVYDGFAAQYIHVGTTALSTWRLQCSSPIITVAAGQYFEARLQVLGDTSVDLEDTVSWFAMEVCG